MAPPVGRSIEDAGAGRQKDDVIYFLAAVPIRREMPFTFQNSGAVALDGGTPITPPPRALIQRTCR